MTTNSRKVSIYSVIAVFVLCVALWASEIPQGIWFARTVYHAQTINGKIEAVKAENERLQKLVKDGQAAQTATPPPAANAGS